jgi:hypothetical protein
MNKDVKFNEFFTTLKTSRALLSFEYNLQINNLFYLIDWSDRNPTPIKLKGKTLSTSERTLSITSIP